MQIYNPNDYPIYHLLPPMIESETEMSKSPASLIEQMLKRIKALEDGGSNGGSNASAEWGKITGNLSDQTDLNSKLYTKADKTAVDLKADKTELADKANKSYVDASLESKVNRYELTSYATKNDLSAGLSSKADKTDLANKVDKTYVDSGLALKADKTYVDSGLSLKANNADLSLKADTSTVEGIKSTVETLETNKADSFTVDGTSVKMSENRVLSAVSSSDVTAKWGEITGNLSDQTDLNAMLNTKADKTAVDLKADKTELTTYATKTDLSDGLSTKADKTVLDTKADNFTVDGKTILMTDQRVIYAANSGDAVNKEYVDTQDALRTKHTDFNLKEDVALPVMSYSRTQGSITDYMNIDLTEIVKSVLPKLGRTTVKVSASYYNNSAIIAANKKYLIYEDLVHIPSGVADNNSIERIDIEISKIANQYSPAFSSARVTITIVSYNGEKVQHRTMASQLNSVPMAFSDFVENEQENIIVIENENFMENFYRSNKHWWSVTGDTIITVGAPDYFPFSGLGICKTVIKSGSKRTLIAQSGGKMWKGEWAIDSSYEGGFTNSRKNVVWTEITL